MTNLTNEEIEKGLQEYKVKSLETIKDKKAEYINRYIAERYRDITEEEIEKNVLEIKSYYIFGGVGTGKTRMAYILIARLIDRLFKNQAKKIEEKKEWHWADYYQVPSFFIAFHNFPKMLDRLRSEINSKDFQDSGLLKYISETGELLILDDVGAEKFTEWSIEILYKIINERYEKKLNTIIISNLSLSELAQRVGDRITSRIAEMCEIKKITGEDKRIKIK
jgi:DNA replication protein DnaC